MPALAPHGVLHRSSATWCIASFVIGHVTSSDLNVVIPHSPNHPIPLSYPGGFGPLLDNHCHYQPSIQPFVRLSVVNPGAD